MQPTEDERLHAGDCLPQSYLYLQLTLEAVSVSTTDIINYFFT